MADPDKPETQGEPPENERWRKRKMVRGRWVHPEEIKKAKREDRVVSVRMTLAELEELDAALEGSGINRNRALRIAARRIGGFLELDEQTYDELRGVARTVSGIATNVNQIAKVANQKGDPDLPRFFAERERLGTALSELQAVLQPLLDVGKRRTDGLRRLKDMAP